jgi:hypothetical protein
MKTRTWPNLVCLFLSQNCLFGGTYIYIKLHIHFLVHGHSSWSTFDLHLMSSLKALYLYFLFFIFLKELDHGSWTT